MKILQFATLVIINMFLRTLIFYYAYMEILTKIFPSLPDISPLNSFALLIVISAILPNSIKTKENRTTEEWIYYAQAMILSSLWNMILIYICIYLIK